MSAICAGLPPDVEQGQYESFTLGQMKVAITEPTASAMRESASTLFLVQAQDYVSASGLGGGSQKCLFYDDGVLALLRTGIVVDPVEVGLHLLDTVTLNATGLGIYNGVDEARNMIDVVFNPNKNGNYSVPLQLMPKEFRKGVDSDELIQRFAAVTSWENFKVSASEDLRTPRRGHHVGLRTSRLHRRASEA